MHGLAPRVVLGEDWWDCTRRAAYSSTGQRCIACGVSRYRAAEHKWLEGHEIYEVDFSKQTMTYKETVPLCHYCHSFIHSGRLRNLVAAGKETVKKYNAVVNHGNGIVQRFYEETWSNWRLVIDGKGSPPALPTYRAWEKKYGKESK